MRILVIGGGCFGGVTAAELTHRGHKVTIVDRVRNDDGQLKPGNIAATNDDNKLIRIDYGEDAMYTRLCAMAISPGAGGIIKPWKNWYSNAFRQCGLLLLDNKKFESAPDSFASLSIATLKANGFAYHRKPVAREKVFNTKVWCDSYLQPDGGWADCGQAVKDVLALCESMGVKIIDDYAAELIVSKCGTKIVGVKTTGGNTLSDFDEVVVAAGSRTTGLLPHLKSFLKPLAQVVVHFRAEENQSELAAMPAWAASIRDTGFYGFPMHPRTQACKVGYHGPGYPLPYDTVSQTTINALLIEVRDREELRFRSFIKTLIPSLATCSRLETRVCMYIDSNDSDFVIDRDTRFKNVVVASGGSGHAFKFMPVVGVLIANKVVGTAPTPALIDATARFGNLVTRMANTTVKVDSCRAIDLKEDKERAACVERALRRANNAKL